MCSLPLTPSQHVSAFSCISYFHAKCTRRVGNNFQWFAPYAMPGMVLSTQWHLHMCFPLYKIPSQHLNQILSLWGTCNGNHSYSRLTDKQNVIHDLPKIMWPVRNQGWSRFPPLWGSLPMFTSAEPTSSSGCFENFSSTTMCSAAQWCSNMGQIPGQVNSSHYLHTLYYKTEKLDSDSSL